MLAFLRKEPENQQDLPEPPSKDKEVNASTSNISDTIELQEHQHADDDGNVVVSDLLEIDKETSQQSKAPPFP